MDVEQLYKLHKEIKRREQANLLAPFPVYSTEVITDLKICLKIKENMITKKEDYNNVPVTYCKTCGSLHIKTVKIKGKEDVNYCVPCGNTDLGEAHIEEWEDIYEEKNGEKFIKEDKDE